MDCAASIGVELTKPLAIKINLNKDLLPTDRRVISSARNRINLAYECPICGKFLSLEIVKGNPKVTNEYLPKETTNKARSKLWHKLREKNTFYEKKKMGLVSENQSFVILNGASRKSEEWMRDQLATALENIVINER